MCRSIRTQKVICDKIDNWKCPSCFYCGIKIKEKLIIKKGDVDCEVKTKNEVRKGIISFIPEIIEKIEKYLTVFFNK